MSPFELLDKMLEKVHDYPHKARHYNRMLLKNTRTYRKNYKDTIKKLFKNEDTPESRKRKRKYEIKTAGALKMKEEASKCMFELTSSVLEDLEMQIKESGLEISTEAPAVHNAPNVVRIGSPTRGTFCECRQPAYGDMVFCDSLRCRTKWFHFKCVWLSSVPKGSWFCPECRKDWRLSRVE